MAKPLREISERASEHDINTGEHSANDKPVVDCALYHNNTAKLKLRGNHETRKEQKKEVNR